MATESERPGTAPLTREQRVEAAAIILRDAVEELLTAEAAGQHATVGRAA